MKWTNADVAENLPALRKAVSEGLADGGLKPKEVNDVIALDMVTKDLTTLVEFHPESATTPETRVTATLPDIWRLEYTTDPAIELGTRWPAKPKFSDDVLVKAKQFGREVRDNELRWVLKALVDGAKNSTGPLLDPASLSAERLLILDATIKGQFEKVPKRWTITIGEKFGPKVIVYQANEPLPVVHRLQDFELSGEVYQQSKLIVTLTSIVRLENATTGTKHTEVTEPAGPPPPPPPATAPSPSPSASAPRSEEGGR